MHSSSKWKNFKQPLPLILQTFQDLTVKNEDFWYRACPFFERKEYAAGAMLYKRGDRPNGFYLLEDGIFRAEYDLPQGKYYESIVAGTTCGELPFFSATNRTATVAAEKDCVAWLLGDEKWEELQKGQPDVAQELLRISLKLTSERMSAITSLVSDLLNLRPLLTRVQIRIDYSRMRKGALPRPQGPQLRSFLRHYHMHGLSGERGTRLGVRRHCAGRRRTDQCYWIFFNSVLYGVVCRTWSEWTECLWHRAKRALSIRDRLNRSSTVGSLCIGEVCAPESVWILSTV